MAQSSRPAVARIAMVAAGAESDLDVAVLGGGPAGTATALTLLRYTDLRVGLIERGDRGDARVGEAVSSGLLPMLRYLGVEEPFAEVGHLPSRGGRASWGDARETSRDALFSAYGHGWHLDRAAFDRMLLDQVALRGGTVWLRSRVAHACRSPDCGWTLGVVSPGAGQTRPVRAHTVIDATGRACGVARRVGARPRGSGRLVGVTGQWLREDASAVREELTIEACELGWWYSAPVPGGRSVVALMSDADLVRAHRLDDAGRWCSLLRASSLTWPRLGPGRLTGCLLVRSARPQVLQPVAGPGWLAAGDAAMAHDPLASLGIGHALASGAQAARIVGTDWQDAAAAREVFGADVRASFRRHLESLRAVYGWEQRWPSAPFWRRRAAEA